MGSLVKRIAAKVTRVDASVSIAEIENAFFESFAVGDRYWWWPRMIFLDPNEFIVDDGYDQLYRVSFEVVSTDPNAKPHEKVKFGDPVEVRIEYVDIAAKSEINAAACEGMAAARGERVAARFQSREESRQVITKGGNVSISQLRAALGLSDDTPEDEVLKVAAERITEGGDPPEEPATTPGQPATPGTGEDEEPEEPAEGQPATQEPPVVTPQEQVAAGAATVDRATLAQLQADAKAGREARDKQVTEERESLVAAAIADGRIPPARKGHWLEALKIDFEGNKAALASLEKNLIPVEMRGQVNAGHNVEGDGASIGYPANWLPEVQARKAALQAAAGNGGSRVLTDAAQ